MRASGPEPRRDVVALVVAGREASRVLQQCSDAGEFRGPIVAVLPRALGRPEVLTALLALGDLEQQPLDAGVVDQLQISRREPLRGSVGRLRELGHEDEQLSGLRCRFGDSALVNATLVSGGGEGPQSLRCASPRLDAEVCTSVPVRVTNNGDNGDEAISDAEQVLFTYYEEQLNPQPYFAYTAGDMALPPAVNEAPL